MEDITFDARYAFFASLHKEAAPSVRSTARAATRAVVDTNALPIAAKKPVVTEVESVKSAPTSKLSKTAFVEGLVRDALHLGQRGMEAAAPVVSKAVSETKAGVGNMVRGAQDAHGGFQAGFKTPKGGALGAAKEKFKTLARDNKKNVSWSKTLARMFSKPSAKVVGSDAHHAMLVKTKGERYANAFRAGQGVKGAVDPSTTSNAARHFVDSDGKVSPLTIFKGLHSTGIVTPEASQQLLASAMRRPSKPWSVKKLSDTQMLAGGATLGGLGYLALRKRSPEVPA